MRRILSLLICVVLAFASLSCAAPVTPAAPVTLAASVTPATPAVREPKEIRLMAVGDNLIHDVIYQQAKCEAGYDFSYLYEHVSRYIRQGDVAFINQETPLVPGKPPSSYPMFNTPVSMAQNLQSAGFSVVNIANNHMLDMGADGLAKTIETIRSTEGLTLAGAYLNEGERDTIPIVEIDGVKLAFLGFTQHTNGISPPADRAGMIVYTEDLDEIERLTRLARSQADIVVASVHWGEEGSLVPSSGQKELAGQLADYGVDLVIGTHPHVLQPWEYLNRSDGGRTLVLYSLGNFVSAQVDPANLVSAIADVSFLCGENTKTWTVTVHRFIPIVTHYEAGFQNLSVYLLDGYTEELAAKHGILLRGKSFGLDRINQILRETIGVDDRSPGNYS